MFYDFGPKTRQVYRVLHQRITSGELLPGAKLPAHTALARSLGVAPQTVRQVLAMLEAEGRVSRQQGRGTFVCEPTTPAVLIVDDDRAMRALLRAHLTAAGYRPVEAGDPAEGLAVLERDATIALVLSDVRMPTTEAGIAFIRVVRRRWPMLPLAAVTGYPDDLAGLHGTSDCPVLILPKPFRANQIDEILRLTLQRPLPLAKGWPLTMIAPLETGDGQRSN